eukprot:scaffold324_cov394-Prasinococcus_capsulatus_cf.AAC.6
MVLSTPTTPLAFCRHASRQQQAASLACRPRELPCSHPSEAASRGCRFSRSRRPLGLADRGPGACCSPARVRARAGGMRQDSEGGAGFATEELGGAIWLALFVSDIFDAWRQSVALLN